MHFPIFVLPTFLIQLVRNLESALGKKKVAINPCEIKIHISHPHIFLFVSFFTRNLDDARQSSDGYTRSHVNNKDKHNVT